MHVGAEQAAPRIEPEGVEKHRSRHGQHRRQGHAHQKCRQRREGGLLLRPAAAPPPQPRGDQATDDDRGRDAGQRQEGQHPAAETAAAAAIEPGGDVALEEQLLEPGRGESREQQPGRQGDKTDRRKPPAAEPGAQPRREQLPEMGRRHERQRHRVDAGDHLHHRLLDDRCEHEAGHEAQHHARQAGHHLDRRLDPGLPPRVEKLAGIDRREEGDRGGEEHRIDGGLDRAEDQRHQAKLRLERFMPRRFPGMHRVGIVFIPDPPEERPQRHLGIAGVERPGGEPIAGAGEQGVFTRRDQKLAGCARQLPAIGLQHGVAGGGLHQTNPT